MESLSLNKNPPAPYSKSIDKASCEVGPLNSMGKSMFGHTSSPQMWIPADGNMEDQIDRTSEVVLAYVFNRVR